MEDSEKLSKSELKRRMKAEKKTAEKEEKAKVKAETQPAQTDATKKPAEEEISPNEYFKVIFVKIGLCRGGTSPGSGSKASA